MTETNSRFEQASIAAKSLPERPDNDTLLQLYALYKQGSAGDVSGAKPGLFDFVATAKYKAWEIAASISAPSFTPLKKTTFLVSKPSTRSPSSSRKGIDFTDIPPPIKHCSERFFEAINTSLVAARTSGWSTSSTTGHSDAVGLNLHILSTKGPS